MKEIICKAIKNRLVIKFTYDNQLRIVEPFALGFHKDTGNLVLRSYRVGGYSKSKHESPWRLFDTSKIQNLEITTINASSNRENYNPNDKDMSTIVCNV